MHITIKYFASLREALGVEQELAVAPPEVLDIADLRRWLALRGGVWEERFGPESAQAAHLRQAFGQQMCDQQQALEEGCEVAFFPPVTGG
ncbi:MoaD/ThiS family protein [Massilia sp. W12]|uniref:MoaD/ThiS family protein n=1 Tax=Massilia sp. W12 TaxID=3126507 RepID=UPI0030CE047B